MKHIAMNPYLPLYEYIPDGEPRIFDGRLYIYGSHDYAGGEKGFCPGDYMIWSAPLEDIGNWRCGGTGFPRSSCPGLKEQDAMAAPDVVQGTDGRYYMYWNTNSQMICQIAVSSTPDGPFTYYGEVRLPDGTAYSEYKMFDPGVLVDDDGKVYLYIGFCMPGPVPERFRNMASPFAKTSLGFELEQDMRTIKKGPVAILPGGNATEGTGFEGHGFYEASSPRKINGKYVMVYSSEKSHELAYAVSDKPLGTYSYMGALVSSADFGIDGGRAPVMPYGNVHGGLVKLKDNWYIFYHRQTHGVECCRQGCAERLSLRDDGWFSQAEITSCGLNNGPLPAQGEYNACYCCYLTAPQINPSRLTIRECRRASEPHIYEEAVGEDETKALHYIANIQSGTAVGYKYFTWNKPEQIRMLIRGDGKIEISIHIDAPDGQQIGRGSYTLQGGWEQPAIPIDAVCGVHALYFNLNPSNTVQFQSFTFL